jgi:hypothetical protein
MKTSSKRFIKPSTSVLAERGLGRFSNGGDRKLHMAGQAPVRGKEELSWI